MKRPIILVACIVLAGSGVYFRSSIGEAWDFFRLHRLEDSSPRVPYRIEERDNEFFAQFSDTSQWNAAPIKQSAIYDIWGKVFDTLKWEGGMESVLRFYQTDTQHIGVFEWMLSPAKARLAMVQTMSFRKVDGGVLFVSSDRKRAIELAGREMASLIEERDGKVTETLLVSHRVYERMLEKQKTAQPVATDNPDDAQRLREDH